MIASLIMANGIDPGDALVGNESEPIRLCIYQKGGFCIKINNISLLCKLQKRIDVN
jgi:hypothetical protein